MAANEAKCFTKTTTQPVHSNKVVRADNRIVVGFRIGHPVPEIQPVKGLGAGMHYFIALNQPVCEDRNRYRIGTSAIVKLIDIPTT